MQITSEPADRPTASEESPAPEFLPAPITLLDGADAIGVCDIDGNCS